MMTSSWHRVRRQVCTVKHKSPEKGLSLQCLDYDVSRYNQNTKSSMEFQIGKLDQIFKLWRWLEFINFCLTNSFILKFKLV